MCVCIRECVFVRLLLWLYVQYKWVSYSLPALSSQLQCSPLTRLVSGEARIMPYGSCLVREITSMAISCSFESLTFGVSIILFYFSLTVAPGGSPPTPKPSPPWNKHVNMRNRLRMVGGIGHAHVFNMRTDADERIDIHARPWASSKWVHGLLCSPSTIPRWERWGVDGMCMKCSDEDKA